MEISKLITAENNIAIQQVLVIAKQDMAIENALKSLNELIHVNRIEFESYGKSYGITAEILTEIRSLQDSLTKTKFGKY